MTATIKNAAAVRQELLPFVIRPALARPEMLKAVSIRQRAYARHVPEFAATLGEPEESDYDNGAIVLLAESKLDGSPLGSMRIQNNLFHGLKLEDSIALPAWLQDQTLAEATRLGVAGEAVGRLVRIALFKAYYFYCLEMGIDWMVITARKPLDRLYEGLQFRDVVQGGVPVPMRHVGNIPHRVMAFSVMEADQNWSASGHPLYDFMIHTDHPDIRMPEILAANRFSRLEVRERNPAMFA